MKERFTLVPASYLILIRESKILLLRRFNTGYEDGKYSMVAGHLDGNETVIQTIIREAREEAGVELQAQDLEVVHVMHRKQPTHERIDFFIQARKWEGTPRIMEPHKCDDLRWFELDSLPSNIIPFVKQVIECLKNNIFYSEHGW